MDSAESDLVLVITWQREGYLDYGAPNQTARLDIRAGETFYFGISDQLEVFEAKPTSAIGCLEVSASGWSMSNFTGATTFVIENLEDGAELVKVGRRRLSVTVPFEMSLVSILSKAGLVEMKIFGPPPILLEDDVEHDVPPLTQPFLDERRKYFLVLVALCESRLRGSSMAAVPSVPEVVERLKFSDDFKSANRSSINYHIDYLRESKMKVDKWAMSPRGQRMHSKREALVSFALRYDLVREEHLALLPSRIPDRSCRSPQTH